MKMGEHRLFNDLESGTKKTGVPENKKRKPLILIGIFTLCVIILVAAIPFCSSGEAAAAQQVSLRRLCECLRGPRAHSRTCPPNSTAGLGLPEVQREQLPWPAASEAVPARPGGLQEWNPDTLRNDIPAFLDEGKTVQFYACLCDKTGKELVRNRATLSKDNNESVCLGLVAGKQEVELVTQAGKFSVNLRTGVQSGGKVPRYLTYRITPKWEMIDALRELEPYLGITPAPVQFFACLCDEKGNVTHKAELSRVDNDAVCDGLKNEAQEVVLAAADGTLTVNLVTGVQSGGKALRYLAYEINVNRGFNNSPRLALPSSGVVSETPTKVDTEYVRADTEVHDPEVHDPEVHDFSIVAPEEDHRRRRMRQAKEGEEDTANTEDRRKIPGLSTATQSRPSTPAPRGVPESKFGDDCWYGDACYNKDCRWNHPGGQSRKGLEWHFLSVQGACPPGSWNIDILREALKGGKTVQFYACLCDLKGNVKESPELLPEDNDAVCNGLKDGGQTSVKLAAGEGKFSVDLVTGVQSGGKALRYLGYKITGDKSAASSSRDVLPKAKKKIIWAYWVEEKLAGHWAAFPKESAKELEEAHKNGKDKIEITAELEIGQDTLYEVDLGEMTGRNVTESNSAFAVERFDPDESLPCCGEHAQSFGYNVWNDYCDDISSLEKTDKGYTLTLSRHAQLEVWPARINYQWMEADGRYRKVNADWVTMKACPAA